MTPFELMSRNEKDSHEKLIWRRALFKVHTVSFALKVLILQVINHFSKEPTKIGHRMKFDK